MFFSSLFKKKAGKKTAPKIAKPVKAKKVVNGVCAPVKKVSATVSKATKTPHSPKSKENDVLRPGDYFDVTRCDTITRAINALPGIAVVNLTPEHPLTAAGFKGFDDSGCTVKFTRNEFEEYSATLGVAPEQNGSTYRLRSEIFNIKGKKIFERTRTELDFLQVENALVFVFISAFSEL